MGMTVSARENELTEVSARSETTCSNMSGFILVNKPPHYSCQRTMLFQIPRSMGIKTGNQLKEKRKLRVHAVHFDFMKLKSGVIIYKEQYFTGMLRFLNPTYLQIYYL